MQDLRWRDLEPDAAMVQALERADEAIDRGRALTGSRADRNGWSNRFADACAVMVANEVRRSGEFDDLEVRPTDGGPSEPLTFVAGDREKKVDVVVSSVVSGLQVGFSLKGMNFRDNSGLGFDKNLTGRTYELQDEVSVIHRYQPASFMVALYFMPLAAATDKKTDRSPSSFARTVQHLRARTGRLDPTLPSQMDKVDAAFVALYVAGDSESHGGAQFVDELRRGVVRYFDVREDPPRRGRPRVGSTMDLAEMITLIALEARGGQDSIEWADPE